ncbi:8813_t:CDS:2 [Cetraspora pellucida]|uniref:8813_t:CDS:1 n=1 Tax=Cetraspora pellucida TaxID=1433469 RepID=A0ACA9KNT9_9GLOM|nr:8813_t:CDS:2 [Cetraspora pellucida]
MGEERDALLELLQIQYDSAKDFQTRDQIGVDQDPLEWWNVNKNEFPVLSLLALKYLSIPATSVPSKRLFSDAENYISAKHTRLSLDLVNQTYNSQLFASLASSKTNANNNEVFEYKEFFVVKKIK